MSAALKIPLTLHGKVPWSVTTYFDGGRLGHVGVASSSQTVEEAIKDSKEWAEERTTIPASDLYLCPQVFIVIGYNHTLFDVILADGALDLLTWS